MLLVIFIIICVSTFAKRKLPYIYTKIENDADSIEARIREILWKAPSSGIVIVTYGEDIEAEEILERLKEDFPQIHIIASD